MQDVRDVVVTGAGVISPIGTDLDQFWDSLVSGRSGVVPLSEFDGTSSPQPFGGEIRGFDAGKYVRPRKALKVMSRDIQIAFAAAEQAAAHAAIKPGTVDPERYGVSFGADMIDCDLRELVPPYRKCMPGGTFEFSQWGPAGLPEIFPLWMLKYLPNMPACHIAIAQNACGPNNTLTMAEASSLAAIAEAVRVIQRNQADVMLVGGTSSRLRPSVWLRLGDMQRSQRSSDPAAACRPFDADRDGMVHGEGAAALILESRAHAEARGAKALARVVACAEGYGPLARQRAASGEALRAVIREALHVGRLEAKEIGHVNAHGLSTVEEDRVEAEAIRDVLDGVPVTAPKSFFGNLAAATGMVEAVASLLALQHKLVPPTLNYQRPDPCCPITVVHGSATASDKPTALLLNQTRVGHAAAVILTAE
jgi:3-oxoacyl-[acyl-carrier-protein] synthase II